MLNNLRNLYLGSFLYDKKISKYTDLLFKYKPSTYLLSSLIKIKTKKNNIADFSLEEIWTNYKLSEKQFKKLNNFFWIFSLDLKSSSSDVQKVITKWINVNNKYNSESWEISIVSKRVISWLSNSKLTYDNGTKEYKKKFDLILQKQILHLLNQVNHSKNYKNKIISISAIILFSLCYSEQTKNLNAVLDLLKKFIKETFDKYGFPKSRSIRHSIFYLKYLILIREWFKESQNVIPEFIDEYIFYLGQSYSFFWKNINFDAHFNGNNLSNNFEFDQYLKRCGYTFKNQNYENSSYVSLYNKKTNLFMDIGPSPEKNFSDEYQAGSLSFEFLSNGKKIFTNAGYYEGTNNQLNELCRSSALQNTLVLDDNSSCKFSKNSKGEYKINTNLKIIQKNIVFEKNYWKINASHDGYLKQYNLIYEREIEYFPENFKLIGTDKIKGKKDLPNLKFDIRFHLDPSSKVMKTQDNKTILIEIGDEGWKFNCNNYEVNIENGLFFNSKSTYVENQNIFISGIINSKISDIKWELIKI